VGTPVVVFHICKKFVNDFADHGNLGCNKIKVENSRHHFSFVLPLLSLGKEKPSAANGLEKL